MSFIQFKWMYSSLYDILKGYDEGTGLWRITSELMNLDQVFESLCPLSAAALNEPECKAGSAVHRPDPRPALSQTWEARPRNDIKSDEHIADVPQRVHYNETDSVVNVKF